MIAERELAALRAEEPERDEVVTMCVRAWRELETCREIGMEIGAIRWDAILAWCEFHEHELDHEAATQIMAVIRHLDVERAQREASKRALASAAGGK